MLDAELLIAYTTAAWLSIMTPGPAALLAMRNGASLGLAASLWSTLGNAVGLMLVSTAAASGVGLLLQASAYGMLTLKVLGAMYLGFLGIRMLVARSPMTADVTSIPREVRRLGLAREGFLVASSNPKAILFFTAFFPQFLRSDLPLLPQFTLLTAIFVMLSALTLSVYAVAAARARAMAVRATWRRAATRGAGLGFIVFAAWLLLWKPASGGRTVV